MALKLQSRKGQALCSVHRCWHPISEFNPKPHAISGVESSCREMIAKARATCHSRKAKSA